MPRKGAEAVLPQILQFSAGLQPKTAALAAQQRMAQPHPALPRLPQQLARGEIGPRLGARPGTEGAQQGAGIIHHHAVTRAEEGQLVGIERRGREAEIDAVARGDQTIGIKVNPRPHRPDRLGAVGRQQHRAAKRLAPRIDHENAASAIALEAGLADPHAGQVIGQQHFALERGEGQRTDREKAFELATDRRVIGALDADRVDPPLVHPHPQHPALEGLLGNPGRGEHIAPRAGMIDNRIGKSA